LRATTPRLKGGAKTVVVWFDATLPIMSKRLVTDEVWEIIEPLLPPEPPKPRVVDLACRTG